MISASEKKRPLSDYRQSLKGRILKTAMEMFSAHGIKAVKMDDIASRLGISKRTLYELYENKEVLLSECVKSHNEDMKAQMREFASTAENVMDVVLFVYQLKNQEILDMSPLFFEDIQKYPSVTSYLEQQRQDSHQDFLAFMLRGVNEGYFRADVNYQLFSILFEALGGYMREHRLYQQYSSAELFNSVLLVMLRGMCTPKGVEVLDRFLKK